VLSIRKYDKVAAENRNVVVLRGREGKVPPAAALVRFGAEPGLLREWFSLLGFIWSTTRKALMRASRQ
jgi:hypothetical protein